MSTPVIIDGFVELPDYGADRRGEASAAAALDREWRLQRELYASEWRSTPEQLAAPLNYDDLATRLFGDAGVDIAVVHSPATATVRWEVAAFRERFPGRVLVMAGIDPFFGIARALDDLDRAAESGAVGISLDQYRLIDGVDRSYSLADEAEIYPLLERCGALGLKVVSVRKGNPRGLDPMDPYRVADLDYAARDFPQLSFEVVHAGLTFLDEFALQMARFTNVWANLATTNHFAMRQPRRLAEVLGEFGLHGAADRVVFGSGALGHPRPLLDALRTFRMPTDMVDEGYFEMTDALRTGLLGGNAARLHGLDLRGGADSFAIVDAGLVR
ncbi:amidohydrolase family protein [Microbacterium atlanticum]|uniref:amidohydrolase family protein n=1 Tax=Microbacterium atlanticum TaxID=2782168 RepID=UPI001889B8CC|nr:amidohydrolase family protein [Microbacterium atlanticum]